MSESTFSPAIDAAFIIAARSAARKKGGIVMTQSLMTAPREGEGGRRGSLSRASLARRGRGLARPGVCVGGAAYMIAFLIGPAAGV